EVSEGANDAVRPLLLARGDRVERHEPAEVARVPLLLGDEETGRLDVVRVAGLVRMPAGVAHEVVALGLLAELERLDGARDRLSLDRVELAACLPGDRQELAAVPAEVREPFGGRARTPCRGRRRAGRGGRAPGTGLPAAE